MPRPARSTQPIGPAARPRPLFAAPQAPAGPPRPTAGSCHGLGDPKPPAAHRYPPRPARSTPQAPPIADPARTPAEQPNPTNLRWAYSVGRLGILPFEPG